MTDIQAAVGREQLQQFSTFQKNRDSIFSTYKSAGLNLLDSENDIYCPVRYRAIVKTKYPNRIIEQLERDGVKSIIPIDKNELLDNPDNYTNAKRLSEKTISLPIYPNLDKLVVNKICKIVSQIV
jgi:dTDP-4-amino-4,6-dideoxygalactose transaminase